MDRETVVSAHKRNNPWWDGLSLKDLGEQTSSPRARESPLGRCGDLDLYERSDFDNQYENVRDNRLHILAAPNGIGKTTTLCRIAHQFGEEKVIPDRNLFYIPCSKPIFKIGTEFPIFDAIDWYIRKVQEPAQQSLSDFEYSEPDEKARPTSSTVYIFADDIHLIDDWAEQVTKVLSIYSDLNIVVTAPTAEAIETDPFVEAGVEFGSDVLFHRKFFDWIASNSEQLPRDQEIIELRRTLRRQLLSYTRGDSNTLSDKLATLHQILSFDRKIGQWTSRYLQTGDNRRPGEDVSRNIELTIHRDIPRVQMIGDPAELHVLFAISAVHAGETHSLKEWSSMLNVDRRTFDRYLDLLEKFYLVTSSTHHTHQVRRSLRLYPRDPAHIMTLSAGGGIMSMEMTRRLSKSVIYDHCKRLAYFYSEQNAPVAFWESNGDVVDYVIETSQSDPSGPVPIAFAGDRSVEEATESLRAFRESEETTDLEGGIVLTPPQTGTATLDDTYELREGAVILPMWLFLLIV